jgi:hypothetical protein
MRNATRRVRNAMTEITYLENVLDGLSWSDLNEGFFLMCSDRDVEGVQEVGWEETCLK